MLEIKKIESLPNGDRYGLFVDGILSEGTLVSASDGEFSSIETRTIEASDEIMRHCVNEMPAPDTLNALFLRYSFPWSDLINSIFIPLDGLKAGHSHGIYFESEPDLSDWRKSYTYAEYCKELSARVGELEQQGLDIHFEDYDHDGDYIVTFEIRFPFSDINIPIISEVNRNAEILHKIHEGLEDYLTSRLARNFITVSFDFPKEVKVPCEQYLLYFVQFLHDIGIEATSDLKHEAGQVLFTVTQQVGKKLLTIFVSLLKFTSSYLQVLLVITQMARKV